MKTNLFRTPLKLIPEPSSQDWKKYLPKYRENHNFLILNYKIISETAVQNILSFLTYKEMRNLRLVNKTFLSQVSEQCMSRVLVIGASKLK